MLWEALQIDDERVKDWSQFKRAFTPRAVRRIHEAVVECWPQDTDLESVLRQSGAELRAVYVGDQNPEGLARAITRHCLYADKILIADPFIYSPQIRPSFSPIEYPEHYLSLTVRHATIFLQFLPWIDRGLVEFVRTPADFDLTLRLSTMKMDRARFEASDELQALTREFVREKMESDDIADLRRQTALMFPPDDYLRRTMKEMDPSLASETIEAVIRKLHEERDQHPYFIPPMPDKDGNISQMHVQSTGMGHTESRVMASLAQAYLVTDIRARWRMIEMDREYDKIDSDRWSPIAKAFAGVRLKYLDAVTLDDALRMRLGDHLVNMRAFLRRAFIATGGDEPYADSKAADLGAELTHQVNETEAEWNEIDRELLRDMALGVGVGAAPAVVTGGAAWVASGLAAAGAAVVALGASRWKRKNFVSRHPAAFFMDLKDRTDK